MNTTPAENHSLEVAHVTGADAQITMGFSNAGAFALLQRTAKMFAQSTMVPTAYQAVIQKGYGENATYEQNPGALANCAIALDMANRMNANPIQVMQNLHIIEGRPSWSSQFIIAAINSSGKFSPLRFELEWLDEIEATFSTYEWVNPPGGGKGKKEEKKTKVKVRNARCVAWAIEKETGQRLESAPVTIEMAVNEGWYGKNGSKWKSMPDLMLRYRSAAFFGRIYAPELLMGLPAADEVHDVIDVYPQADGSLAANETEPTKTSPGATVRSKSEKKRAEAQQAPQDKPADVVDEPTNPPASEEPAPAATTEPGTEQQPQQGLYPAGGEGDRDLTDTEYDYLLNQMEQSAIGSADIQRKFGVKMGEITLVNYRTVLDWVKAPA